MIYLMKPEYDLVVVAHPDDESIFFGGLIHSELQNPHVICVTDGNADGQGESRWQDFTKAMDLLGVKSFEKLQFPDVFENRIAIDKLVDRLQDLETPKRIFTHGPLGEYGHPHHQDVCMAVHKAFKEHLDVYGVAHNCEADHIVPIQGPTFELKAKLLSKIHFNETKRFINLIPLANSEGFCRYSFDEVQALYEHFTGKQKIKKEQLKKLMWYWPYLEADAGLFTQRLF
jgi:LmbE family N-acetylglucosaminyl deacetylase